MIKLSERSNYDIRFIWIKDFFPETSFANLFKNTLNQDTQVKEGEVCDIEDSSPNPSSIRPALWLRVTHLVSNEICVTYWAKSVESTRNIHFIPR